MRKVLSFVLVLSLVLGSFGMAFAAPLSDMAGEASSEAVNVLTELGVVKGYPDGTYKPDKIVTRAEMAVIVVSALGLADYAVGTSSFKDMGGHWSNSFVAYATSLGVIAGYPDGTFKPDKTVSYDEAATMLVAALGYTPDSLTGTWPANYVIKAKTLGILDGIKAGTAGANRGDIAIMAFQTLAKEIGKVNKDGEWKGAAKDEDEDTMLSRLGAELYTPKYAGAEAGDEFVVEGDEDSVINLKPYLGANVIAYANSDEEIIAIKEVKSVYITGEFNSAGDKFETDDVDYNYNLTSGTAILFDNGVVDTAGFAKSASGASGEYTLAAKVSGKRITDVYSAAKWTVIDAFLFEEDMQDDDSLNNHKFTIDEDTDEIDLDSFYLVGVSSLKDIKKDNVVYVYVGGSEITKIEVGTETAKGVVTRAQNEKYTVDGKAYEVAGLTSITDYDVANLKVENEVKLFLDANGKVFIAELIDGATGLQGIVLDSLVGIGGLSSDKDSLIKLFLFDGTEKTFTVDTKKVTNFASITTGGGIASTNKVVEYSLDKDGKITKIEEAFNNVFAKEDANNVLISASGYVGGYKIASDAVIVTNATINESAKTFTPEGTKDYKVTSLDKVKDAKYDAVLYNVKDGQVDFLVIEGVGSTTDAVYGIVKSKFKTVDWDHGVEVYIDGKLKEYGADQDYNVNTVYEITFDTDGDAVMDAFAQKDSYASVYNVKNGRAYKDSSDTEGIGLDSKVVVYVIKSDGKLSVGGTSDLKGNKATFYNTDDDNPDVATIVVVEK